MKIIQSFWTNTEDISILNGNWKSPRYHFMSWCLSCLLLQKHFGEVHLYSTTKGKDILIDMLQLPYSSIDLSLDSTHFNPEVWTLNKLYVYSLQNEPFLHFDGDAYLWQRPTDTLLHAALVGQFIEIDIPLYNQTIKKAIESGIEFPSFMTNLVKPLAINAGVIGGQNYFFYKELFDTAYNFTKMYSKKIKAILNPGYADMAVLIEQCFYKYLADNAKLNVSLLERPCFRGEIGHVLDFNNILDKIQPTKFSHIIGTYKQDSYYCLQVERWLQYFFPNYYSRVNDFIVKA